MIEKGNILAIDDDRFSLKLLESYLKDTPYQVTVVEDPEEALTLLSESDYDLVLSDIRMPVLDGFELLKRVKLDYSGLPLIMITAHGTISDAVRAPWKGNVRELENFIENLVVMSEGDLITLNDFPYAPRGTMQTGGSAPAGGVSARLGDVEREHILRVLEAEDGNRSRTARVLGISLRGLRYKLKAYAEKL